MSCSSHWSQFSSQFVGDSESQRFRDTLRTLAVTVLFNSSGRYVTRQFNVVIQNHESCTYFSLYLFIIQSEHIHIRVTRRLASVREEAPVCIWPEISSRSADQPAGRTQDRSQIILQPRKATRQRVCATKPIMSFADIRVWVSQCLIRLCTHSADVQRTRTHTQRVCCSIHTHTHRERESAAR